MTDPAQVLSAPGVAGLLDFEQPIAVITAAVLHFVPNSRDPHGILEAYRKATAPGSMLVFSHGALNDDEPSRMTAIRDHYQHTSHPLQRRTHAEVAALLAGWDILDPGLVDATEWRPDAPGTQTQQPTMQAAVAVNRGS